MRIAVKKDEGSVPGGVFHYMLHPNAMATDGEAAIFHAIGYHVLSVNNLTGERLLKEARETMRHQVEIAYLTEDPNTLAILPTP